MRRPANETVDSGARLSAAKSNSDARVVACDQDERPVRRRDTKAEE